MCRRRRVLYFGGMYCRTLHATLFDLLFELAGGSMFLNEILVNFTMCHIPEDSTILITVLFSIIALV